MLTENTSNLHILDIESNNIKDLALGTFDHFTELEELNLSNNKINNLHENMFVNLKKLQNLNIGNNDIDQLLPNIFGELKNLEKLELIGNKLNQLNGNIFGENNQHFYHLNYLSLNSNKLFTIAPLLFSIAPNITELNLSKNNIVSLNYIKIIFYFILN